MSGHVVPVARDVLGALDQLAQHLALPEGRQVGDDEEAQRRRSNPFQPGAPCCDRRHAGAQQDGGAEDREGKDPRRAAERKARIAQRPVPEEAAQRRGGLVGVRTDGHEQAQGHQEEHVAPVPEPRERCHEQPQQGQGVGEGQRPPCVRGGGLDPCAQPALAVEVPVAEAAERLWRRGGVGHDPVVLRQPQCRQPVPGLDRQSGHPPEAGRRDHGADAGCRTGCPPP